MCFVLRTYNLYNVDRFIHFLIPIGYKKGGIRETESSYGGGGDEDLNVSKSIARIAVLVSL